jgi:hypothetical protein
MANRPRNTSPPPIFCAFNHPAPQLPAETCQTQLTHARSGIGPTAEPSIGISLSKCHAHPPRTPMTATWSFCARLPACSRYSRWPPPEYATLATHTFPLFAWDVLSCRRNACMCACVLVFALCRGIPVVPGDFRNHHNHFVRLANQLSQPRTYYSFLVWVPIASFVLRQFTRFDSVLSSSIADLEVTPTAFERSTFDIAISWILHHRSSIRPRSCSLSLVHPARVRYLQFESPRKL